MRRKIMRINPIIYGVIVVFVFYGIILGFQAAGVWSTSGKVAASGEAIQPSADDVNTIKGWMTLDQITTTFNVPLADLLEQFDLPAGTPAATAIKDLESDLFSVTTLRTWLQSRSQPVEAPQTNTAAPAPAQTATQTPDTASAVNPAATEHITADKTVTGKTTFQEVFDWGVSTEAIQKIIGNDLPAPSTVIKDFITGKGLEFPTIKSQLQAEVDKPK
jgi:hypothetical protein